MEKYDKLNNLKDVEFKQIVGVKKETFELMCNVYSLHNIYIITSEKKQSKN